MIDNSDSVTKSFEMMEKAMEKAWEMWKLGLTSFTSAQEQIENMARTQLDQNTAARNELVKMEGDVQQQIRRNQEQLQKMIEDAVNKTFAQTEKANQEMIATLSGQVDFIINQLKQNQDQMHNMIKETVLNSYLQNEKKQYNAIANLTNQVEDLSKKMINLSGQIQKITKKPESK